MNLGISVVIITLNEEKNIANAILSVRSWTNEVIVVDMTSDDSTREIAQSLGAKVLVTPRLSAFDGARAIGVEQAQHVWILMLDADEVIPISLSRELTRIAERDVADVCKVPRLNYILGKPMFHGLHGPTKDYQLRFVKKQKLQISDRVHSFISFTDNARVSTISYRDHGAIHHFHAANAYPLIEKMNRYTTLEAEQLLEADRTGSPWRAYMIGPLMFIRSYFLHSGWIDGWRGLYWAWMMAFYRVTRETKHLQLTLESSGKLAPRAYSDRTERILQEYEVMPKERRESNSNLIAGREKP
jgi:glycosyltransferase involved in cell wall biosynthesis